jgi:DNA invertase Pin-like site-specific DNA recombinase
MTPRAPKVLRLDGYVRVSQVRGRAGDSFISPSVQRERIEQWCGAYGHELVAVHEELDESGKAGHRRKLLEEAIARVERGETDGIVVWKADRFGRGMLDGLAQMQRITAAGGRLVAVADGLDTSTETGRLVLRIMLSIAEHELERIRGTWADAKARAVARGIHPSATPPFGYRREGPPRKPGGNPTGALVVDPETGPIVTELFQRRADGAGFSELARWLQQLGARSQWGRSAWSIRAVKDIIRNEVYLGVAYSKARGQGDTFRNEDAHPPLTDQVTFRRAQRPGVQFVPKVDPSPVRALLRCAGCRYKVRAERRTYADGRGYWVFACRAARAGDVAVRCTEPVRILDTGNVEAWIVEEVLEAWPRIVGEQEQATPELADERQAVDEARARFEQWRDDSRVQERLGMDAYLDGLAARQDEMNAAIAELARKDATLTAPRLPDIDPDVIRDQWPSFTRDEQRELLAAVVKCVFVRHGSRDLPLGDRMEIVFHGTPLDLPARGDREFTSRPYVFSSVEADRLGVGVQAQ